MSSDTKSKDTTYDELIIVDEKEIKTEDYKNILLIGASQHGKSALGNFIVKGKKPKISDLLFPTGSGRKAHTKMINYKYFTKSSNLALYSSNYCVIDTPGLLDTDGQDNRNLLHLLYILKTKRIFNAICVVVRYKVPLTEEFYTTMKFYIELLKNIVIRSGLLIVTDFPMSKTKIIQETEDGINLKLEIDEIQNQVEHITGVRLPVITIDSKPEDEDSLKSSLASRQTILDVASTKNIVLPKLTIIPKLPIWVLQDFKEIASINGEMKGVSIGVKLGEETLTEVVDKLTILNESIAVNREKIRVLTKEIKRLRDNEFIQISVNCCDEWRFFRSSSNSFNVTTKFPIHNVYFSGGESVINKQTVNQIEGYMWNSWFTSLNGLVRITARGEEMFADDLKIKQDQLEVLRDSFKKDKNDREQLLFIKTTSEGKIKEFNEMLKDLNEQIISLGRTELSLDDAYSRIINNDKVIDKASEKFKEKYNLHNLSKIQVVDRFLAQLYYDKFLFEVFGEIQQI